jgi:hypothetical protein
MVEKPAVNLALTGKAGYGTTETARQGAEDAAELAAEAVWTASLLNGNTLITTGTLTQVAANSTHFTYSASPSDKLLVKFANGNSLEFVITTMNGDFSNDAQTFLQNDHHFAFSIVIVDNMNLQISSLQSGGAIQASVKGQVLYEGVNYSVDMVEQGTYTSTVDVGSAEYERTKQTTGNITANDFALTINESYRYKSIYVDNFVENVDRQINNTWTQGGNSYAFTNVRIRKAFFNAKPSELDSYWIAQGVLTENGQQIGQIGASVENLKLQIWLQLPNEKVILEEYIM